MILTSVMYVLYAGAPIERLIMKNEYKANMVILRWLSSSILSKKDNELIYALGFSCVRCGAVISLSMSAARCIVEGRDLGEQYEFEKSMIEEVKTEVLGEKWA
jgi:hypothetical protein